MQSVYKKYIVTSTIVWAASFVLFAMAYFFVLGPQSDTLALKKKLLAQGDRDFARAMDAYTGVTKERLDKEIGRTRSKLENYAAIGADSSKLIVEISQIATRLNVIGLSSKGGKDSQSFTTLPQCKALGVEYIYVSFKGSFSQFARFVNELERHTPVIFVDKFTIARSDQSTAENEITMVLSVFVCPQNGVSANNATTGQ